MHSKCTCTPPVSLHIGPTRSQDLATPQHTCLHANLCHPAVTYVCNNICCIAGPSSLRMLHAALMFNAKSAIAVRNYLDAGCCEGPGKRRYLFRQPCYAVHWRTPCCSCRLSVHLQLKNLVR